MLTEVDCKLAFAIDNYRSYPDEHGYVLYINDLSELII